MTGLFTPGPNQSGEDSGSIGFAPLGGMVVDASGHITYDFEGHIRSDGIDLDATLGLGGEGHVRWQRANGALIAQLYAFADLFNAPASFTNALFVDAPKPSGAAGAQALLLDSDGESSFLQLATPPLPDLFRKVRFGFGTQVVTWPGGSNFANDLTLNHGLGFTPARAWACTNENAGAGNEIRASVFALTSTQMTLRTKYDPTIPGAGFAATVEWFAIG